jgi:multiple sugar transport system permease protein
LTRGGPAEATNTLITRVFMISFLQRDFGIVAANGVIWIIFLIAFSLIYLRLLFFRKDETI